jgi:exosortase
LATNPNSKSILKSSPRLVFFILSAVAVALWWSPLAAWFALASQDEQYTHVLLILPISVALILLQWESPTGSSDSRAASGFALLVIALVGTAIVRWIRLSPADVQLSLNILLLVAWWMGAFLLCFATRAFRRALFPLCFLLWMVPIPQFVLNPMVGLLQHGSAASAHWLFTAARIPVDQRGMLMHIPGLTLEVAPECSSIRSSMMLLVTTMVLAQLLLLSFWRKAVVVAVAIPLSVAKNGLRIFVIAVLTTRVDPSFLTGRLHRQGGVVFFGIALLGIFLVLWILRRDENQKSQTARSASPQVRSIG